MTPKNQSMESAKHNIYTSKYYYPLHIDREAQLRVRIISPILNSTSIVILAIVYHVSREMNIQSCNIIIRNANGVVND